MLSPEIKERIFKAANDLYAASPDEFPSVEAVRQASRAGMQNVVEALKEWRQKQRQQVQAVREPLPANLLPVVQGVGLTIWEAAQELANEKLDAARAAFESEKQDYVSMSAEQSAAFETQTQLLEQTQQRVSALLAEAQDASEREQATSAELHELRQKLAESTQKATLAEQRAAEVEHRAQELRKELDHAHIDGERQRGSIEQLTGKLAAADQQRAESQERTDKVIAELRQDAATLRAEAQASQRENEQLTAKLAASDQQSAESQERTDKVIAELRQDVATLRAEAQASQRENAALERRVSSTEAERNSARDSAAQAREEAAELRGQLAEASKQTAALLANLNAGKASGQKKPKSNRP